MSVPSETQVLLDILEGLSRAIRELVDILRNARRVQEGDYVLTTDITDIMQAIDKMIEYNDNMLQLLLRLNYEPPAYIVTYMDRVKELRSQLHEPLSGDIVDAYQWATVTEILRIEYEVLTGLLEMQDILFTHEQLAISEDVKLAIEITNVWPFYHYDIRHTGATNANNVILIGNNDYEIVAIMTSGTELWRVSLSGPVGCNPSVAYDGTIYVEAGGYIYAIDSNGDIKWSREIPTTKKTVGVRGAAAIATDGTVIVPNSADKLYSISPDGTINWSLYLLHTSLSSPIIDFNNNIYISIYDIRTIGADSYEYITVYGVAAISWDGTTIWETYEGGYNSPAEFSDNEIVIGTLDGYIKIYDKSSGEVNQWIGVCSKVLTAPAVIHPTLSVTDVIVGCEDNKVVVVAFGLKGGPYTNIIDVDGPVSGVPAVRFPELMAFGTQNATLYIVTSDTESPIQVSLGSAVYRPAIIGGDNTIYVADERAVLYAVRPDGSILWQHGFGSISDSAPTLV